MIWRLELAPAPALKKTTIFFCGLLQCTNFSCVVTFLHRNGKQRKTNRQSNPNIVPVYFDEVK